jgi:LuxR family maltose regulon positive regulatory protein
LADIDTRIGRPDLALEILEAHGDVAPASIVLLARATALLAKGELERATASLRPVLTSSGVPSTRPVLVAALVLQARILHEAGDPDGRAAEQLVRALELGDGEIVLPFVRTYELIGDVIAHHPLLADQWPIAVEHPVAVAVERDPSEVSDPLTEKEHAVLRWLATSLSTTEIAAELGLSVNTVKTHIAAIYRKLAASRRRDAVLRARRLELL